VYSMET